MTLNPKAQPVFRQTFTHRFTLSRSISERAVDYFRLYFAFTPSMFSQDQTHRVYLSFQCRNGWHCQFLEQDLKTALPRKLHFASSDKVVELVERAGGFTDQDARLAVSQGIELGRGGIFLKLTEEHYAKLSRR
jgi:hypothetical protein